MGDNDKQRTISDVLQDPDTEWKDIRAAMKSRGRPDSFYGATTNAAILQALARSSSSSTTTNKVEERAANGRVEHDAGGDGISPPPRESSGSSSGCLVGKAYLDDGDDGGNVTKSRPSPTKEMIGEECSDCQKISPGRGGSNGNDEDTKEVTFEGAEGHERNIWDTQHERKSNMFPADAPERVPSRRRGSTGSGQKISPGRGGSNGNDEDTKEVTFEGAEGHERKMGDTEHEQKSNMLPAHAPKMVHRRRRGSTGSTSFIPGSLRNVYEHLEADMGNHVDVYQDTTAQLSGVGDRRSLLRKGNSARGSSSRSIRNRGGSSSRSLKNVKEDGVEGEQQGRRPHNLRPPLRRASIDGGSYRSTSSNRSMSLFASNTSASSGADSLCFDDSINVMDFGVCDKLESMRSLNLNSSMETDNTNLVDSCGFLAWGERNKAESTRSIGIGSAKSEQTEDLVDSHGFLAWSDKSKMGSSRSIGIESQTSLSIGGIRGDDNYSAASTQNETVGTDNTSNLVDSSGFLAWGHGTQSSASITSSEHGQRGTTVSKKEGGLWPKKRSNSFGAVASDLIGIIDQATFDGGKSKIGDQSEVAKDEFVAEMASEDGPWRNSKDRALNRSGRPMSGALSRLSKSVSITRDEKIIAEKINKDDRWRIEDYESSDCALDTSGRSGKGVLSRLSKSLRTGFPPKRMSNFDSPKEVITTEDIKSLLLKGGDERLSSSMSKSTESHLDHKPTFSKFFTKSMTLTSSSKSDPDDYVDDEYYSGPAIRINKEDDVDIRELRKELCMASNDGAKTKRSKVREVTF